MIKAIFNPWIIGIIVFILVRLTLGELFDLRSVCSDGWRSPSIGKSGACSYHGGVDRSAASAAFVSSLVIGFIAAVFSSILWEKFDGKPTARVMDIVPDPQVGSDIADQTKPNPSAFLTQFNKVSNYTIKDIAKADSVTITGDCIACRQRFSWRGQKISTELDAYLSETINSARGKIRCPNCNSILQLTFKEEPP